MLFWVALSSFCAGACFGIALGGYLQRPFVASVSRLIATKNDEIDLLNDRLASYDELADLADDADDTAALDPDPDFSPFAVIVRPWEDGPRVTLPEHRNPLRET